MKRRPLWWSLLLFLLVLSDSTHAQQRALLYSKSMSKPLEKLTTLIRDPHGKQIRVEQLPPPSRYFVRILPRKYVLNESKEILPTAVLGAWMKPFVFFTTPEGLLGRSLLDIYADIGYEAEGIISWQRNEDMVAVIFRYPDNITVSPIENGRFGREWPNAIYSTTWDNITSVLTRLVQDQDSAVCKEDRSDANRKEGKPARYLCVSPQDRAFVLKFSAAGKQQLKTKTYIQLKAAGGQVWEYRSFLENQLSVFEHFRGDGHTENELVDLTSKNNPARLPEVVGPNYKIKELPEVAVIHLGRLIIGDCYSDGGKDLPKCDQQ